MDTIRNRREELGMSIAELHRRSGVSRSYISEIENGVHMPTFSVLERLVRALSDSATPTTTKTRSMSRSS